MKLKSLRIKGFKNLTGENGWFYLDFTNKDGITVLIGNNGSGKSNVLEAISAIFTGLYKLNSSERQPKFEYIIEYNLKDQDIEISNKEYRFKINNNVITKEKFKSLSKDYLPNNIIASYSGEEKRLWDKYYNFLHSDFKREINSYTILAIPSNKLFNISGTYWNEALVTLLLSKSEDNKKFVKEQLNIDVVNSINFEFNTSKIKKKKSDVDTNILLNFLNRLNPNTAKNISLPLSAYIDLFPDDYERDIFIQLTSCSDLEYIKNIKIKFNEILNTEDLSEGQKKQILIKATLDFIANEHSLILLDEPDSHIHIINKVQLKELLYLYKDNRETIMTTHSPTLTHAFDEKHITIIVDGKIENRNKQEVFSHISDGIWNYQEQSVFLSSDKNIILLVEGKHDKTHIIKAYQMLKNDYPEIEFNIFQMNGENNIKHMLLGLANHDIDLENKKVIGIFDNDKAGKESVKQNFKEIDGKNYKQLVDNTGKLSNNFFTILLPKKENFTKDFTIENMYSADKYKNALKEAFANRSDSSFYNDFVDDISKQIKEDAKNILAEDCEKFKKYEDFEHFKKLFDLIKEIKEI